MKIVINNKIKTMKKIILLVVVIISTIFHANAQMSTNQLSNEQYAQIKFNNVFKSSIENTEGNSVQLQTLLGAPLQVSEGTDGYGEIWKEYKYTSNFEVHFAYTDSNESSAEVYYIKSDSVQINGTTMNVGTMINLSNFIINQNTDGTQSVIFSRMTEDCCVIVIGINSNGIITSIEYLVWT